MQNKLQETEFQNKLLVKLQYFGVQSIEEISSFYKDLQKESLEANLPLNWVDKKILSKSFPSISLNERDIMLDTVRLVLQKEKNPIQPKELEKLFSRKTDQGRMLPTSIDFQKKDWMVFDSWAKFDPVTSTLMSIFWGVVYSLIFYFFYMR